MIVKTVFRCSLPCMAGILAVAAEIATANHSLPMAADQKLSIDKVAQLMVQAPRLKEVSLSPDGNSVLYSVARGSIETNQHTTELLLQRLSSSGESRSAPVRLCRQVTDKLPARFEPQWCPDGGCVTYFGFPPSEGSEVHSPVLLRYHLASQSTSVVSVIPLNAQGSGRTQIAAISNNYRWSPKGRFIAFTASFAVRQALDPRRGVQASVQGTGKTGNSGSSLFVLDIRTGAIERLTEDSLNVSQFDWAPNDQALAFSATPDAEGVPVLRTDLFTVDRATRTVRPLVTRPGMDGNPRWSPDGKWIVFASHFGEPKYTSEGSPAMIPATGGSIVRLSDDDQQGMEYTSAVYWLPDSRAFFYDRDRSMTRQLLQVNIGARRVTSVMAEEQSYDNPVAMSRDGRWLAFTREWLTYPAELLVQALPDGEPIRVTSLAPNFPLASQIRVDRVSWPSKDREFAIHGLLLTPRSTARSEERLRSAAPLPTLIYLFGGPSTVRAGFAQEGLGGAMAALASQGYAVFAPNTRGRGGYGSRFQRGMRDGNSAGRLPFEDMMGGVDHLIKLGIADSSRLGIFGHSYGGYLTSYAITRTDRFTAAAVHEAHIFEWFTLAMGAAPGSDWELLKRDLYGMRDPFDPAEWARLTAESPGLNMRGISTPVLLDFGAHSNNVRQVGWPLFGALQRLGIPSEFVLYDEGHVITRPAAIADDLARITAWFDYWIRGYPYPDPERGRQYERWRKFQRGAMRGD